MKIERKKRDGEMALGGLCLRAMQRRLSVIKHLIQV
jgi:hypothetical protein